MIPHTAPPFWPGTRLGRLAAAICRNSAELRDDPNARDALRKCRIGLIGLPDDTGVELNYGRAGAREGPHAFRAALARYGSATPMAWQDARSPSMSASPPHSHVTEPLPYPHIFDAGDLIPGHDIHETHERVTVATTALIEMGLFPIAIGGGHDLTFPFVRAVTAGTPSLHGVYIDAHLDVRETVGSGMAFRRLVEDCGISRLTVVGLDPLVNSVDHFRWFAEHNGRVELPPDASTITADTLPDSLRDPTPKFVSIDMDAIDQSSAPGVSAMNPVGLSSRIVAAYAHAAGRSHAVRCFDIMELNPTYDERSRTARLAAYLFLSFLNGFAQRP